MRLHSSYATSMGAEKENSMQLVVGIIEITIDCIIIFAKEIISSVPLYCLILRKVPTIGNLSLIHI